MTLSDGEARMLIILVCMALSDGEARMLIRLVYIALSDGYVGQDAHQIDMHDFIGTIFSIRPQI
jgi:hypothetical protein